MIIDIRMEALAQQLEQSPDYRVLRRLTTIPVVESEAETHLGLYLDVETTGLDVATDEIIEFGAVPFRFTADGFLTEMLEPIHCYNHPLAKKIGPEITKITGITMDRVRGHTIPVERINATANATKLVVAHNAGFDRQIVERPLVAFRSICWGCSMTQVPWDEQFGITGRRLEYVLASLGRFYDAHNAISDCMAGLFALQAQGADGRTALWHLLEASRKVTFHVWALDAPFAAKDNLKARGYEWSSGEDKRPKAWHKEIDDQAAESKWLVDNVYGRSLVERAKFVKVNAFNRFSKGVVP